MASLAEASVAGFQPEPVSSRVWACPQPRRLTRGSAHPGTAPMVRPLTALRDPSLLLPALLSAAARPLTSLSVLRATPPRAQRADPAAAETPRRPDAAPAHPPAPLTARLARSLARSLLFLSLFALSKHYPGHVSQQQPTHSRHFLRRGCARRLLWQRQPRALELEIGDLSSRARVSEDPRTRRGRLHRAPKQPWNCAPSALGSPGRCQPRAYPRREDNYSFYSSTGMLAWRKRAGNPALNACNFPM